MEPQDLSLHGQLATYPPGTPSQPWASLQGNQEAFCFLTHSVPQVPVVPGPRTQASLDSLPPASLPGTFP